MITLREHISYRPHRACCIANHTKCPTHQEVNDCPRCNDENWIAQARIHIDNLIRKRRFEANDSLGVRERNTSLRILTDLIFGEKETRKCQPGGRS